MRIAFFDPFSGASGDMILGAMLDAGLPLEALLAALRTLPLPDWTIQASVVRRGALSATLAHVVSSEQDPPHRHLADVLRIIDAATLPGDAASQARTIFTRLAEAEAHVHRESLESVHFHEVGAADAILDICGAVTGLKLLGIEQVYCGPLPTNSGRVETAHGTLPLPAPATLELLARAGAPTVPHPATKELLTPTGAAVLSTLATFARPAIRLRAIGYGAGSRTEPIPNVLRLMLGDALEHPAAGGRATGPALAEDSRTAATDEAMFVRLREGTGHEEAVPVTGRAVADDERSGSDDSLMVLESNLDDMNPQWFGHLFELLLARGALDVTSSPVLMKKGRPGQLLSVLCHPEAVPALTALLLAETTTLGVRRYAVRRQAAGRAMVEVGTPYGPIPVKLRVVDGLVTGATPEYDACYAAAHALDVPLPLVSAAAQAGAQRFLGAPPP